MSDESLRGSKCRFLGRCSGRLGASLCCPLVPQLKGVLYLAWDPLMGGEVVNLQNSDR